MSAHAERYGPVGGRLFTGPVIILAALAALAIGLIAWRFVAGIGAVTALNDGYPWGLWITMDVVVGTALATGGYAVAILVYLLNRGQFHPLIRPAIVTSAMGYTLGGFGVILDLGRFYNVYQMPFFWNWNFHSVLLEVALCITTYVMVLWVELSPAFLDRFRVARNAKVRAAAAWIGPRLETALPFVIALGLLLPTMHQSSLGSLMMLAGRKLHPLWQTPFLPLLFLITCLAMGYAVVVIESALSGFAFKRKPETPMLASLAKVASMALWLYLAIRIVDTIVGGRLPLVFAFDRGSILFLVELGLFATAATLLALPRGKRSITFLFRAAIIAVVAGALYRFSTFLLAYNPGHGYKYFPAVPELLTTIGLFSLEVLAYIVIVKTLPILTVEEHEALAPRPRPRKVAGEGVPVPVPFDGAVSRSGKAEHDTVD